MNVNYPCPYVDSDWYLSRETHEAVASAIHAIADGKRSPEAIWDDPTTAELDHVMMAISEYLRDGDFPAEPDDCYAWGQHTVEVKP